MQTIFKINLISKKMKDKPKGMRLYFFFEGAVDAISPKQKKDIKKIITDDYNMAMRLLGEPEVKA